jgi:hypothetical protein
MREITRVPSVFRGRIVSTVRHQVATQAELPAMNEFQD